MSKPDIERRTAPEGSVIGTLNAFNAERKASLSEEAAREQTHWARISAIIPIQDAIAPKYKEAVLDPRKKIWDTTIGILQRRTPESVDLTHCPGYTIGNLTWKIEGVTSLTDEPMGIKATITAGMRYGANEDSELVNAIEFAAGEDPIYDDDDDDEGSYNRPIVPRYLLGVARIGRGRNKTIPQEPLLQRLAEKATPLANDLEISIEPAIGGNITLDVYRTDATQGDNTLLMHDRTYDLEEHVKEAGGGKKDPTLEEIQIFLANDYAKKAQDGVGSDFRKLRDVNKLLVFLHPTPKASK